MKQCNLRTRPRCSALILNLLLILLVSSAGEAMGGPLPGPALTVASLGGPPGAQVLIPVLVQRFTNILTIQFTFNWNPNHATFVGVEQFGLPQMTASGNFGAPRKGALTFSWDYQTNDIFAGQNLPDGTNLFVVRLQVTGPVGATSSLFIDGSLTALEVTAPPDANHPDPQELQPTLIAGQLTITQPNVSPVLAAIGNQTVNEGTLLTFTNLATDADIPAQTLTFSLDAGAPPGTALDPVTGLFTWTPTESQGPGTYPVTIRVTDDFSPPASASETITIIVNEVNTAPVLLGVADKSVNEQTLLIFTNSATDADIPPQTLTFKLYPGAPTGAAIDPLTGVFTWTPTEDQGPGTYLVVIGVSDNGVPGASVSETITITVNEVNTPPVLAAIGSKTVNEQTLLTFTNSATDGDIPLQTLTYGLDTGAPTGTAIDPITGVFTWTPTEAQGPGTYSMTIRVTDDFAPPASASETITIIVNEVNTAPVLDPIGNKTVNEQTLLTFTNSATDGDIPLQTLTYSLDTGAPTGTAIDPVTGVFTWTPAEAQGPGTYPLTIRVTDNGSPIASAAETITVTVNEVNTAPVLAAIGNKTLNEQTLLVFTNTAIDTDIPLQTLTYSLDAGAPPGTAIDPITGIFTWTPAEVQGPGTYPVTIRVTDDFTPPASASQTITITVNEVNTPPMLTAIGNKTVNEQTLLTFTNSATDVDIPLQTLTYSLDAGAPPGTAIDPVTGVFTWTPTEAQGPGSYPVVVRVNDNGAPPADAAEIFTITVNEVNTAPVLTSVGDKTVTAGTLLSFTNSATDADIPLQTLTYGLDAGAPPGTAIDPITGVFTWTPTEAQGPGPHPVTIRATDNGSPIASAAQTIMITVNEVNTPPVLAAIGNKTVDEQTLLTFTNTATDADIPLQTLTYTLDQGAPSRASINSSNGVFNWVPTEVEGPGTYSITVRVTDSGSPPATASQTFVVTVNEVNTPPVLLAIGNKTADEESVFRFTAKATDADYPPQTLSFSLGAGAPPGAVIDPVTGVFSWMPTEAHGPGAFSATIFVTDDGPPPLSASETILITVKEVNTAPVLTGIGNKTVNEQTLLTFTNTATDADIPVQTLTYSLDAGAPPGTAIDPVSGVFTWTPTEAQGPGSYPVVVRVTDNGTPLADAAEIFTITVNEVNTAPVLTSVGDKKVTEGTLLSFTNSATDADIPLQTLTYSLGAGAPPGAELDPATGVFTWTPTEAQGPGNYPVTIRVADNGSPPANASEAIFIRVTPVRSLVLGVIGNKTVDEGSLLTFTTFAVDVDFPPQIPTFSLDPGAPSGAAIDRISGVFTWTPAEEQGPGIYPVTIRVSDYGSPPLSAFETILIAVNEINTAPLLAPISDKTVGEGYLLMFTNRATDADIPAQILTFSLDAGAPGGAAIDPASGVFIWTPPEVAEPTASKISVIVTDDGTPSLSATQSFSVTIQKTNHPPAFLPLTNFLAEVLIPIRITNLVTDPDIFPTNRLTFQIAAAPKGTRINKFTGVVTWMPARSQARSRNLVTIFATDDGNPSLSATNTFEVTVDDYLELSLGRAVVRVGQTGSVALTVTNSTGVTNLISSLFVPPNQLSGLTLTNIASELRSAILAPEGPGLSTLSFSTAPNRILQPGEVLADLQFTATATRSAFVPLLISNVISIQTNGVPLTRILAGFGRVVVVGNEPLVEVLSSATLQPVLALYGEPGLNYAIESSTDPTGNKWQPAWQDTLTNVVQVIQLPVTTNRLLFFRAVQR